jgi:hypothetical protein
MAYKVRFPKGSFFHDIQTKLKLEIEIDPEMKSSGSFCYSFQHMGALMRVKEIADGSTYMHEFVHACQVLSGPPTPGNEMFRFDRTSLKNYALSKGLVFDEECALLVEEFLLKMIAKGLYTPEDFMTEYPAYYVESAFEGEKVFEAIWADTQKLIKRSDSFWRQVQRKSRKEWIKDNLIHFLVPSYLALVILLMLVYFLTKPEDKPFFRPWVTDLINQVQK